MLTRLPNLIDPLLLADKNACVEGDLQLSICDRLAEFLFDNSGCVRVTLHFARNGRLATIKGHVSAVLVLKCQRCLEGVEWPISSDIKLSVVNSLDQANNLPDSYELLLMLEEGKIPLKDIIEDELLLGLPSIPKHEVNCVSPNMPKHEFVTLPKIAQLPTKTPFSILADLKNLEAYNGSTKE
jgi:uncharacterized protein